MITAVAARSCHHHGSPVSTFASPPSQADSWLMPSPCYSPRDYSGIASRPFGGFSVAVFIRATRFVSCALGLALVLLSAAPSAVQVAQQATVSCAQTWVGQEDALEAFMRAAPVLKLEDVPIGVTKPRRAVFEPGGLVQRAAWKPLAPSYRGGFRESYKAEVAAYKLDRVLELHMVPPVIERTMSRIKGALVYWIENTHPWDIKNPPNRPDAEWSHRVSRMRLFDQLVANIDRNAGNLLYDDDGHLFLIDHSRAFTERTDIKNLAVPARIDRALWNRIEALTLDQMQVALGEWLSDKELRAVLARRDRIRDQITTMVARRGETAVFF